MIDLEHIVYDVLADEVNEVKHDELIAALRRGALDSPNIGTTVPGSGCKFCLPQYDDLGCETESKFECDLKACIIHSLVYHALGILQDADLMVDTGNVATARSRLTTVLQTIFSEQKSKEIAVRLLKTLETMDYAPVNNGWAD